MADLPKGIERKKADYAPSVKELERVNKKTDERIRPKVDRTKV